VTGSGKKAVADGERAVCGLRESVVALPGVGAKRAEALARMGIHTLGDLLTHAPRRYEDRQRITSSEDAEPGMAAVFVGEVMSFGSKPLRGRSQRLFEAVLQDAGGTIRLRWWQGAYLEKAFALGRRAVVYGKPASTDPLVIDHPDLEWWDEKPFIPEWRAVYPSAQGLTQKLWRQWVVAAQELCAGCWREPLPDWDPRPWPKRCEAIAWLHWPQSSWAPSVARTRLALDEWIDFRMELSRRQAQRPRCVRFDHPIEVSSEWSALFQAALPFEYTQGQRAVLEIVGRDLSADRPMRRLLQGDVGSGKTAIAAAAAVMVLEQGYDVTLMAPTEALARQHYLQLRQWMETLPVEVELVVGGGGAEGVSTKPTLFVGTSALLHRRFDGRNLGLNIIDEQHRFGVAQRVALGRKAPRAHMLAMTATPIPRTLAMTIFADLESTELREVPPGRGPGATYVRGPERMEAIYDFVRQELDSGRQAFFVFPRIEADDTATGGDALEAHFEVIEKAMKPFRTGKAHGGNGGMKRCSARWTRLRLVRPQYWWRRRSLRSVLMCPMPA